MVLSVRRIATLSLGILFGTLVGMPLFSGAARANGHLYPDVFPFVDEGGLNTLENWTIDGNILDLRTVFANQGAGLFEIRRGAAVPGDPNRDQLFQRVYIGTDGGNDFEDINIGTTPRPSASGNLPDGRPGGNEAPSSSGAIGTERLIWFEDFTRFSLHEAIPVGDNFAVGAEVAGDTKASFALQATSRLPGTPASTSAIESDNNFFQLRISPGFGDLYIANDPGNEIDITGVNRDAGLYWLRQTVDPENRITESDETNNSFQVLIDLRGSNARRNADGSFVQPVPEPGTLVYLACLGASSLAFSRRRRKR